MGDGYWGIRDVGMRDHVTFTSKFINLWMHKIFLNCDFCSTGIQRFFAILPIYVYTCAYLPQKLVSGVTTHDYTFSVSCTYDISV